MELARLNLSIMNKLVLVFIAACSLVLLEGANGMPNYLFKMPLLASGQKVLKPDFTLRGGGGGNNLHDFHGNLDLGVQSKIWESRNRDFSIGVGGHWNQPFGPGPMRPNWDANAVFGWQFGR